MSSRYPWRDTSSDIAGGQPPQWETPQGAQQKADAAEQAAKDYTDTENAGFVEHIADEVRHITSTERTAWNAKETTTGAQVKANTAQTAAEQTAATALNLHKQRGADEHPAAQANAAGFMSAADKKKSDASTAAPTADTLMQRDASGRSQVAAPAAPADIARKQDVDDVQNGLNAHKQDTVAHLTQTEHEKLSNIESGAQKNQKAFGSVNGIVAETTTDGLTIEGATGISVTKDGKKIILTATGQSTPGAHAATHLPGGADPIQTATTEQPGLMSAAQATALAAAESKTDATAKLQAAKDYTDASRLYGTTTNTGNAYVLTIANGPSLGKFRKITVEINADSTGAATLSYNGGSALPIRKMTGSGAVAVTNLKAGGIYSLAYSGSAFIVLGEGGEYGDAGAGDVRAGKTVGTDSGLVTGTVPVRATTSVTANGTLQSGIYDNDVTVAVPDPSIGTTATAADLRAGKTMRSNGAAVTGTKSVQATAAQTVIPGTTDQVKAAGIYDGAITVKGDSNLVAANIVSGKTMFGVSGTAKTGDPRAGDTQIFSGSVYKSDVPFQTYTKIVGFTIKVAGVYRTKLVNVASSDGATNVSLRFFVNGVAVGVNRAAGPTATTYVEDFTLAVGDVLELKTYQTNGNRAVGTINICLDLPDYFTYSYT